MSSLIHFEVVIFDQGDAGELFTVGEPIGFKSEEEALQAAKKLASQHNGVVAWRRESNLEVSTRTVLYRAGEIIDSV
ncbi:MULTISPECIES: hypothetical protein [Phyllobacterium]|jgi:hypothetical protein|uniref:hypothetical protein n=1 Tax=Phyllobacterium TaxID=28100 RepID=UPI001CC02578|nr:hypothetical protein [Phyllobacterium calauticae]MBZ3695430.1 hypothetical protein [Phyllobacterium calauticae]